jgi:hypothetical protein
VNEEAHWGLLRQKKRKKKKDKGARVWGELEAGLAITLDFHPVLVPPQNR